MASIVRLNVCDYALLKKPLNLSAVHGVSSQAVYFPTNNALCFARLYASEHIVEDRATGHFCGSLFYKLIRYGNIFTLGERSQFGELGFNGENLLVLDIGTFSGVEKVIDGHICSILLYTIVPQYTGVYTVWMMKDDALWFGKNLKRIRARKGMSQGAIARSLGVGRSFITNIENGKTNLTLATIVRIAKALGVSPDKLLK